jgi:hypothetical protein
MAKESLKIMRLTQTRANYVQLFNKVRLNGLYGKLNIVLFLGAFSLCAVEIKSMINVLLLLRDHSLLFVWYGIAYSLLG